MHAPVQSDIIEDAWAEHFERYPTLARDDLLSAVTEYYRAPQRPWPQPADLSTIARARRRDMADRAPLPQLNGDPPATPEQRAKHMAQIGTIVTKQAGRWSVPKED
jgi:hypothetical protein